MYVIKITSFKGVREGGRVREEKIEKEDGEGHPGYLYFILLVNVSWFKLNYV